MDKKIAKDIFSTKKLLKYAWGTIVHPIKTFSQILQDEKKISYGFAPILIYSLLYSISVYISFLIGKSPTWEPFLKIPTGEYYFWEAIFTIPVAIMGWIMLSGSVQILSRLFKGKGSFEDNLAVLGFTLGITIIVLQWSVDFSMLIFKSVWFIPDSFIINVFEPVRQTIFGIWMMILSINAVKESQKISFWKAGLVTIISFIPLMAFTLTYIR